MPNTCVSQPADRLDRPDALAGTASTTAVRGVPADISGNLPAALSRAGFDADRSTLWSVEGVLPFAHQMAMELRS
ncbi:class I SAM-dependent methyltransferase [Mycobacterium sp. DL440]|uniref:class I SAM-dependent methyltransferase n=1 Tax=Mycobacterium sp. DL440 TaxID=2675523 RepID=UPI00141F9098|nr:class I SAM-dependent methyltransferase [Mycobacterium sp. DL440]